MTGWKRWPRLASEILIDFASPVFVTGLPTASSSLPAWKSALMADNSSSRSAGTDDSQVVRVLAGIFWRTAVRNFSAIRTSVVGVSCECPRR